MLRLGLFLLVCQGVFSANTLRTFSDFHVHDQWVYLDFQFPTAAARSSDISAGYFVLNASVPLDMNVQYRTGSTPRIFVTNPRFEANRAVTLGVIGTDGIIEPYPDYDWNKNPGTNCDGLTSVFRTAIDTCNRLWVLDAGRIGETYACQPQVFAFDLATDKVVFHHRISDTSYKAQSLLVNPIVDMGPTCEDAFIYIADVEGFALVVVDVKNELDWRVQHRLFFPHPENGAFLIQGNRFDLMDGVFGLAVKHDQNGNSGKLYFHALASLTENVVSTSDLKNSTLFTPDAPIDIITELPFHRDSQSGAEAIDKKGIMYFGLMEPPRMACWNTATEYRKENIHIIALDTENLQFISGLKVETNLEGKEEVWVMASAYQKVATGNLSSTLPNFKISYASVDDILKHNPKCADTVGYRKPFWKH